MKNVNLRKALGEAESRNVENGLIDQITNWLNEEETQERNIWNALGSPADEAPALAPFHVDQKSCFSREAIKSVAVRYRLRFLESHLFKDDIPHEAIAKIKHLENRTHTPLKQFYILAPAERFKLSDCNQDPLLFVPLSNGKYYLIHQWGNDLKWYRQWLNFPAQNWRTLGITVLGLTALLSMILPNSFFASGEEVPYLNSGRIIFFFWINLIMAATLSYAGFAFNFTFSKYNWNSKFFNG